MSMFDSPFFGTTDTASLGSTTTTEADIALTATLGGTLSWSKESMTGDISLTATLAKFEGVRSGDISLVASLGGTLRTSGEEENHIVFQPILGGRMTVTRHPTSDPEGRYLSDGVRPFTPLLVHADNITDSAQLPAGLQVNQSFLMGSTYLPEASDGLNQQGAVPNAIGTKVGTDLYVFRVPRDYEVVWYVEIDSNGDAVGGAAGDYGLLRFNGPVWDTYVPVAEQVHADMTGFFQADPDDAWKYMFRLIGAIEAMQIEDARDIVRSRDPYQTPERFLPALARQNGVTLTEDLTERFKRNLIQTAVGGHKERGYVVEIQRRLRLLGYSAEVWEVWAQPVSPNNFEAIEDAPAATYQQLVDMDLRNDIEEGSGIKGTDIALYPHGYWTSLPAFVIDLGFDTIDLDEFNSLTLAELDALDLSTLVSAPKFPTTRIAIELSYDDGTPFQTDLDRPQMRQISEQIMIAIRPVLPAHIDLKFIMAPAPFDDGTDTLTLTDLFTMADA